MSLLRGCLLLLLLCSSFLWFGCRENILLDANAVPEGDNIIANSIPDTLTILTKTIYSDTLVTSSNALGTYHAVGRISSDPSFGATNYSLFFQVTQPMTSYKMDASTYQYDSIILVLPYSGFTYGDTTVSSPDLVYEVYRMERPISKDSVYYAHSPEVAVQTALLGSVSVPVKDLRRMYEDSIEVMGMKRPYHLRIPLSQSLIDTLLEQTGNNPLSDQPSFVSWFNGIHIRLADTNAAVRALPFWRLYGTNAYNTAGLLLYYHTKAKPDTLIDAFSFNTSYTAHFGRITRNYTGKPAAQWMASTALSDSVCGIQNQPGAALDIKLPYVKSLPKGIINKAVLTITEISQHKYPEYQSPNYIYPRGVGSDGKEYIILDRYPVSETSTGGLDFINGGKREVTVGGVTISQYEINFPRELQKAIVTQADTLHLRINGSGGFAGAYHLVVGGRNHPNPDVRMRLNIVYSRLNSN